MAERKPTADEINRIVQQIAGAQVPVLVAGGVAARFYGVERATFDVDLVPSTKPKDWQQILDCLYRLGFEPNRPLTWDDIQDARNALHWIRKQKLEAIRFHRGVDPEDDVDLMVTQSARYEKLRARSQPQRFGSNDILHVGIADLQELKTEAGRPKDIADVNELDDVVLRSIRKGREAATWPDYLALVARRFVRRVGRDGPAHVGGETQSEGTFVGVETYGQVPFRVFWTGKDYLLTIRQAGLGLREGNEYTVELGAADDHGARVIVSVTSRGPDFDLQEKLQRERQREFTGH